MVSSSSLLYALDINGNVYYLSIDKEENGYGKEKKWNKILRNLSDISISSSNQVLFCVLFKQKFYQNIKSEKFFFEDLGD